MESDDNAAFLDMNEEEANAHMAEQLDLPLDDIRTHVIQYSRAKAAASNRDDNVAAALLQIQQTVWSACYEVCRRIEGKNAREN